MHKHDDLPPLFAATYGRNSDLGKRERGANDSIEVQRDSWGDIARTHDISLVESVEEEDTSGDSFDRPGWQRVVELIEDPTSPVNCVVAYDLHRISRGESWLVLAAVHAIEEAGGYVFDRTGRLTVSTEDGKMLLAMRSLMNRREWTERRGYKLTSVRKAIEERKAHLTATYGYAKGERINGRSTPLVIDEAEAPAVRLAFKLRCAGYSWAAIARELNASQYKPRRAKAWTGPHVAVMVGNPVYKGVAFNGEHVTPDAHAKVVSVKTWDQANRVKGQRVDGDGERNVHLLSGLVRCSSCGYSMTHTRRSAKQGGWRYYQCQRVKGTQCPAPTSVPAADLEAHALDTFKQVVQKIREYAPAADDSGLHEALADLDASNAWLARAWHAKVGLGDDATASEQAVADAEAERARAAVRADEAAVADARHAVAGIDLPRALDADNIEALPLDEQRHLLGLTFAAVVAFKPTRWRQPAAERVKFLGRDQAPTNADGRTTSALLIPFVADLDGQPTDAGVLAA